MLVRCTLRVHKTNWKTPNLFAVHVSRFTCIQASAQDKSGCTEHDWNESFLHFVLRPGVGHPSVSFMAAFPSASVTGLAFSF